MSETVSIIVISTLINGRKNYVHTLFATSEGGFHKVVNYSTDPSSAKDFPSHRVASDFIVKIKNPHERIFTIETVEINAAKRARVLQLTAEELT